MRILLLGAGYANISLLKSLPLLQDAQITLISNNPYHYVSVLLHEVASGVRSRDVLYDIKAMLDKQIEFIEDEVIEIKQDKVLCQKSEYAYDILVIGLGFSSDTFGIKGIKEHTYPLVSYKDGLFIYEMIHKNLQTYIHTNDASYLNIAVCGGGFSGAELVSSLAEELPKICTQNHIDPKMLNIYCIEALSNILPMFPKELVDSGSAYIKKLGVQILTNSKIIECKKGEIIIQRDNNIESIFAKTIIWTAGIKGNEVIANSKLFVSKKSRIEVDNFLHPKNQNTSMGNIYVVGDCSAVLDPKTQKFFPPTAQIALRQGEYLARALKARVNKENFTQEFSFESLGVFCALGRRYAVGMTRKRLLQGRAALWISKIIKMKWWYKIGGIMLALRRI